MVCAYGIKACCTHGLAKFAASRQAAQANDARTYVNNTLAKLDTHVANCAANARTSSLNLLGLHTNQFPQLCFISVWIVDLVYHIQC
ncbi:hypothetical protein [Undibacterium umbellatum]|uniref:Uncharacterized protein n=1 Tax=Undibacterium umbellatum TaxID=2762300 RepID=A0ABR6Z3S7_9BURK|nr:hypothetical protein [Undibacterium umbellatum]MBC3906189.1 hypothetical protein [Undibacterium umbellatum]